MDHNKAISRSEICGSCLMLEEQATLYKFEVTNNHLKSVIKEKELTLCYICRRLAENVERFIQNIENSQKLYQSVSTIDMPTLQAALIENRPGIKLTLRHQDPVEIGTEDCSNTSAEEKNIVHDSNSKKEFEIKIEFKEENKIDDDLDTDFLDDDDVSDPTFEIKDEEDLHKLIKQEIQYQDEDVVKNYKRKTLRKQRNPRKKLEPMIKKEKGRTSDQDKIRIIRITRDECLREREEMSQNEKYLNSPFKCEDCVKGFTFRSSYEKHLYKHQESSGDYECDICKQRNESEDKLRYHKKYHEIRYRCTVCNLTRISRRTIQDHYAAFHGTQDQAFSCPHCSKLYQRLVSLKKHILYAHKTGKRAICNFCQKSYANKEVLKAHLIAIHTMETSEEVPRKTHMCSHCGKAFKAPSHLKKHLLKHSDKKDYYCVECDKSFKSDTILKHHLKTATPHVNYMELPFPCLHCDKRFAIRRDLDRHMNSVHLNIKPYQCDKCERAYVSKWSLREHRSLAHEGFKRPLRFPCPMCDKIFDRNQILKAHIRTHTGERPYQCSKCPANFSQASVLRTHIKLIHLKLTRDGRAKAQR